jgi:hypothetical protein
MRRFFLLALPLALIACGSDSNANTGPTLASLAGVWSLQTVNGQALPFTLSSAGGVKVELLSQVATVAANGTFAQVTTTRTTVNGTATTNALPSAGTFSLSGNLITVTVTGSGNATGTLNSSTQFTITDPTTQAQFVFKKQ